ncbi:Alpha-tocopherol transfer protein-like [Zootermopsis nevadensis]|uniref:Alpha-tocopherol transfer protein-like n=1 Tax=Zootermopsis nevadensis TaxID=136037 RepID=A0A067REN9_ZOONE|nr:Alpha-tocopherol transfer protein-like [Zootermopsis nevadensis]
MAVGCERGSGNDVQGSGRGLLSDIIPFPAKRGLVKPQKRNSQPPGRELYPDFPDTNVSKMFLAMVNCCVFLSEAMPLRLKEVHIVNQPFLFNMVWQMFKPFVKEKLKKRLFFHGKKMESLHEHIDPSYLPEDYGGKLPKINYSSVEWYPVLRTLDDDFKVDSPPARDALLVAGLVTPVVPKLVISRATELGASRVEVMQVALDPDAIRDACRVPVKVQRVPVRTGQDNPRIGSLFDDALLIALKIEEAVTYEMMADIFQTTRCNNPADGHLHTRCRENLKSQKAELNLTAITRVRENLMFHG